MDLPPPQPYIRTAILSHLITAFIKELFNTERQPETEGIECALIFLFLYLICYSF